MTVVKMQSYAAIQKQALTIHEVDALLAKLHQRRLLQCMPAGCEDPDHVHVLWKGSMDSGNPAHPRSTSVKVSACMQGCQG